MTDLDDRLRTAAELVHQQMDRLPIPETSIAEPRAVRPAMRNRTLVVLAAAVVVVLMASVAAGIARRGSHAGSGSGIATLGAATLSEAARVRISLTLLEPTPNSLPRTIQIHLQTGVFDFRRQVGRIEFLKGPTSSSAPGTIELLIGGRAYTSIDPKTAARFPPQLRNKRWSEADASSAANPFSSVNPFDPLAQLRQDHVTLHDLGTTRIGTQAVHHYTAMERVQQARPEFTGQTQTVTETVDIYVDNHNRFVRLRATTQEPGDEGTNTNQIDFSDYGTRVIVAVPPADEVAPAANVPLHT